ncbi:MAG: hypothetical protein ABIO55_14795, partial [Ginsengibacter sp.]
MKKSFSLLLILAFTIQMKAQTTNCAFNRPFITVHFGTGNVRDVNTTVPDNYERISGSCPNDGYYSYTAYTTDCFGDQWFTLNEDHTPGDISGNMLVVNSSNDRGTFFNTTLNSFKGGTTYEFSLWLMNICKVSSPCPFTLLPNITISLQTLAGKPIGLFRTGEVPRLEAPYWRRYMAIFTTPPSETALTLTMINNNPGGCGNDFALDDITFRECVQQIPLVITAPKIPIVAKKPHPILNQLPKKATPAPVKTQAPIVQIIKPQKDTQVYSTPVLKQTAVSFPTPPPVLTTRENTLVKRI